MTKNNTTKFYLNNKFDIERFNNLFGRVKHTDFVRVYSKFEVEYMRNYKYEKKEKDDFYCISPQVKLSIVNRKLYIHELCHEDEFYTYYLRSYYLGDADSIEVKECKTTHQIFDSALKHIGYKKSLDFKINGYIACIHKREDDIINYDDEY